MHLEFPAFGALITPAVKTETIPIELSNARLVQWHGKADTLEVMFLDWRGVEIVIRFLEVTHLQATAPYDVELSHLRRSDDMSLLPTPEEQKGPGVFAFQVMTNEARAVLTTAAKRWKVRFRVIKA